MNNIKPFDIGYASKVDIKHGKPVYKIHLNVEKIKQLIPNTKGLADLSLRFREDGKAIIAYENLYKSQGVKDDRNFINLYVNYQKLTQGYENEGKICIVATPKDPSKKAVNDFSKSDYNVFSFQNTGDYKVIGSGFTNDVNLKKEQERLRNQNRSNERPNYIFVGSMNSSGELRLNDTHLQKYVNQSKDYTSLNLIKADNSGKYFCYLSTNSMNEKFDYKFTLPTQQLLNLPFRGNEINLQAVNIDPAMNRSMSDVAIMTRSNFENAYHDHFIKDLNKVEIEHRDVITYGHSIEQFFNHLKSNHSQDKAVITQPKLFDDKTLKDKDIPQVHINREVKPPSISNDIKNNNMNIQ